MWINHELVLCRPITLLLSCYMYAEAAQNFALYKPASVSSIFNSSFGAGNAVDGSRDSYFLTAFNEKFAWWRVDLQEQVTSPKVVIRFKIKFWVPNEWYDLQFYTSRENFRSPDSEVWSPPSGVQNPWNWTVDNDHISTDSIFKGEMRYLLIYTTGNVSGRGAILDFKEVEVWACPEGFYGRDCSQHCNKRRCNGTSICPYNDGTCTSGCQRQYRPYDCTECIWYYYGANCDRLCSQRGCLDSRTSCPKNGSCRFGCFNDFTGSDCSVCKGDFFGHHCNLECTQIGCKGTSSCPRNGTCDDGCLSGFAGRSCSKCLPGLYGSYCSKNCSLRNCEGDSPCSRFSFSCSCKSGWTGDDCTKDNPCPCSKSCYNRDPNRKRHPPPCSANSYGKNCSKSCQARNCVQPSKTCYATDGRCLDGCEAGYKGADCTEDCPPHLYGRHCSKLCVDRMCKSLANTCDGRTGKCPDGCQKGWRGEDCTKNSPEGHSHDTPSSAYPLETGLLLLFLILLWSFS